MRVRYDGVDDRLEIESPKMAYSTPSDSLVISGMRACGWALFEMAGLVGRRFEVLQAGAHLVMQDLKTPPYQLHDRLSAYDFGQPPMSGRPGSGPSRYTFSIDRDRAAAALRRLADRIETGTVTMNAAHVETVATADEWGVTDVRLKLHELLPP